MLKPGYGPWNESVFYDFRNTIARLKEPRGPGIPTPELFAGIEIMIEEIDRLRDRVSELEARANTQP